MNPEPGRPVDDVTAPSQTKMTIPGSATALSATPFSIGAPVGGRGFDLSGEEEAEDRELRAVLDRLPDPRGMDAAATDAAASELLRRAAWMRDDLDRFARAREMETLNLHDRYDRSMEPIKRRLAATMDAVRALAERVDFGGKKKSRTVAYGRYGTRHKDWRLQVDDPAALLAWAEKHDAIPALMGSRRLVRVQEKKDVPMDGLRDNYEATGDLPDGVTFVPERDEPFAEPLKPERA